MEPRSNALYVCVHVWSVQLHSHASNWETEMGTCVWMSSNSVLVISLAHVKAVAFSSHFARVRLMVFSQCFSSLLIGFWLIFSVWFVSNLTI